MSLSSAKKGDASRVRHPARPSGKPAHHQIAALAYALYEQEGRPPAKAKEHWFNAEGIIENNFGYGANHTEHDFAKEDNLIQKMKIIVQRTDTGEFYKGDEKWTLHKDEAHDFFSRQSADAFCQHAPECRIVVHLKRGVADISMSCDPKKK